MSQTDASLSQQDLIPTDVNSRNKRGLEFKLFDIGSKVGKVTDIINIIKEIPERRRKFTASFRNRIQESIVSEGINPSTRAYLDEQLSDQGMTRYYRFGETATNCLKGYGFELTESEEAEAGYGLGLMLFWLRLADRFIDSRKNNGPVMSGVYDYLMRETELPSSEDSLVDSLYAATRLLKEHASTQGYLRKLTEPLKKMTDSMATEHVEPQNIRLYCDMREYTTVRLSEVILALQSHFANNGDLSRFEKLRKFYHSLFKAGMHLDSQVDLDKDYSAGISPRPTLLNRLYLSWRLAKDSIKTLTYLPSSSEGVTRVISYCALSAFNIYRDIPTQG